MSDVAQQSEGKSDSQGTQEREKPPGIASRVALVDLIGDLTPHQRAVAERHVYLGRISELTQQKDGAYISQTDCERQIGDYQQLGGLKVERQDYSKVTCPECKQR